ncbi:MULTISPECIES: precorrin-6y C5,15-methyltransferase (decarboxylating) subunit CbiE [unclassified Leptolyngbya]|uniref:precorrin-6y C5,15-methyltransferase (decarboxylating) subunit CbiE n=1 Tax=unclassified Leptolyngbya TaxID=2650499 RepID=UPI0032206D19
MIPPYLKENPTPIQVVGVGMDGPVGLSQTTQQMVQQAALLVGSDRHLSYFPDHPAPQLRLGDFQSTFDKIRSYLSSAEAKTPVVILVSGDPLFFGLGRLLLQQFSAEQLTFHPHLCSIQLAFNRIKVPWQDACLVSVHGRSPDTLIRALQQGVEKIAVLTDEVHTPGAIATLLQELELPVTYRVWVCENLGSVQEQIREFAPEDLVNHRFTTLNVLVLLRQAHQTGFQNISELPMLGVPDSAFASFSDRPGLLTKREIRVLALGELALRPGQVVWDVGAGTGSVSVEIARLCPTSQVFAIEQTAVGISLIQDNVQRFQTPSVIPCQFKAPEGLDTLPAPDRVYLGGSGGQLEEILEAIAPVLKPDGVIVAAFATLEHFSTLIHWLKASNHADQWHAHTLQTQLARSVPVGSLTRLQPLNPVTLVRLERISRAESCIE